MDLGEQIKDVILFLGRENDTDGQIRDRHLTKIIEYLIITETEQYAVTLAKLALKTGINQRYIRENYIQGMELFGLINVYPNGGNKHWKWIGVSGEIIDKPSKIKIAVKDNAMCKNCAKKKVSKTCIDEGCKNIVSVGDME